MLPQKNILFDRRINNCLSFIYMGYKKIRFIYVGFTHVKYNTYIFGSTIFTCLNIEQFRLHMYNFYIFQIL